jgi:hypothetical protein
MMEIDNKAVSQLISNCYRGRKGDKGDDSKPVEERKSSVESYIDQAMISRGPVESLEPVEPKKFVGWTVEGTSLSGGIRAGH